MRNCLDCRTDISWRGPKALRCPDCAKTHRKAADLEWARRNAGYRNEYHRKMHANNPIPRMLAHAKARAKHAGLPFTLRCEDMSIPRYCPLLSIPIVCGSRKKHDGSPSIDRIDPRKGYTPDNCWVVSNKGNRIKNNATLDELRRIVAALELRKAA